MIVHDELAAKFAKGTFDPLCSLCSLWLKRAMMLVVLAAMAVHADGCTEAPERFAAPDNTILTYNPASNRLYVHLLAYPGTRLACRFADEIAYAQFLHDASEICVEHHGERIEQKQDFYESGCERISYLLLPAVRPDVLVPVIEVILKDR